MDVANASFVTRHYAKDFDIIARELHYKCPGATARIDENGQWAFIQDTDGIVLVKIAIECNSDGDRATIELHDFEGDVGLTRFARSLVADTLCIPTTFVFD